MSTVAEHLAAALAREGITTGFGIPGGETLWILEALRRAGIRFVLARHETGAGLMAEGHHHATGEPGLLVATVGPGVANCPNAVAQALLDRVPLVVVTGNVATTHGGTFTHQVFDQLALLRPLTKASYGLRPETAARDVAAGLEAMRDGRPGPVHFDLPLDVAESPCANALTTEVPAMPTVRTEAIDEATSRLAAATNPLVFVGLEALDAEALGPLVERLGAPALGTYKAMGALPADHPQWIGAAGLSPRADDLLLPRVREADVVLLAGYDAIEMRSGWLHPFDDAAFVIDVSASPAPPPEHRTDLRLVGPVSPTLDRLLASLSARGELGAAWRELREQLAAAFPPTSDWGPAGVVTALRDAVDDDTIVTVDTGAHRILLSQMWRARQPRTLLQSSGLCTMAYALPVALGAALSGRRTVAVVGDGGLEMAPGELATARDLGVDLTVVVIDDRSLALIEKKQRGRDLPNVGVDFGEAGTDFVRLAEAFGGEGRRFDGVEELRAWLSRPARGLRLAHCPIDRRAYDDVL